MSALSAFEEIIDASGAAERIEAMLPAGVRARQMSVRVLLAGMCLAAADHRPAHLTRVRRALISLPGDDQARLGVLADWKHGPHLLTCRQTEYTFGLVADALGRHGPDGLPSGPLQRTCDDLLEASVPEEFRDASRSLAVDWTDLESFSRPPPHGTGDCADPEASWGHRKNNLLRSENELFYGYYLSAAIMMGEENGPAVPEIARRATVSSCRNDPVRAFAPVLTAMPAAGIGLGDILDDSGYAHRDADAWALPLRQAGAQLIQDLHPHDRGPKGTCDGAILSNGRLYCPQAPRALLELGPLARTATREQAADHDRKTAELARCKLGRITADDADGYHRVQCPAAIGKIRCPLRPASLRLDRDRPGDPAAPAAPPGLLHAADDHRPAGRARQDRAEARLPVGGLAPLLRPAHRRRARLRHRQGPRQQRHRPQLVPPHGPDPAHAVHRHAARRPQPAHPGSLGQPAGRKPAPRRQGPAPENPQTTPQDPRRPRRRTALTRNRHDHEPRARHHQDSSHGQAEACPDTRKPGIRPHRGTGRPRTRPWTTERPECQTQT
jgi:hypothetical protein